MKSLYSVFFFVIGVLLSTLVFAQVYNEKYDDMVSPMDQAGARHFAAGARVGNAGDVQAASPEDEKYVNMTRPMDEAAERHFNAAAGYKNSSSTSSESN